MLPVRDRSMRVRQGCFVLLQRRSERRADALPSRCWALEAGDSIPNKSKSKGGAARAAPPLGLRRRQTYIRVTVILAPAPLSTLVVLPLSVPAMPLHGAVPLTLALAIAPVAVVRV